MKKDDIAHGQKQKERKGEAWRRRKMPPACPTYYCITHLGRFQILIRVGDFLYFADVVHSRFLRHNFSAGSQGGQAKCRSASVYNGPGTWPTSPRVPTLLKSDTSNNNIHHALSTCSSGPPGLGYLRLCHAQCYASGIRNQRTFSAFIQGQCHRQQHYYG